MSPVDWLVVVGGAALIVAINWYFFVAGDRAVAATAIRPGGVAEVRVLVAGGYDPATIRVPAGAPVRLVFERHDDSPCSEEVVFPDFQIRRFLPNGKRTTIELVPPHAGTYPFTCGMSMLHGTLIAEPAGAR